MVDARGELGLTAVAWVPYNLNWDIQTGESQADGRQAAHHGLPPPRSCGLQRQPHYESGKRADERAVAGTDKAARPSATVTYIGNIFDRRIDTITLVTPSEQCAPANLGRRREKIARRADGRAG